MNASETKGGRKSRWPGFNVALSVMYVSAPFLVLRMFGSSFVGPSLSGDDLLPISIRATAQADYSQDSQTFTIPPINEDILDLLITNVPATYSAQDRKATLQANLSSPVPTMTSNAQALTPLPTLPPQTPIGTVTVPTLLTSTTPLVVPSTPTATPASTARPTLSLPAVTAIPSLNPTRTPLPTSPPLLPTLPPVLPTILPNLPSVPPVLPTLPPVIPTLLPSLPTLPPVIPTLLPILPTLPTLFP